MALNLSGPQFVNSNQMIIIETFTLAKTEKIWRVVQNLSCEQAKNENLIF